MLEEVIGIAPDSGGRKHVQLIARRDMLDEAWNAGKTHLAQGIGPMAPIVEDQPSLDAQGIEEIGAEAHAQADDTERPGRWAVLDLAGIEPHIPKNAQAIGG